MLELIRVLEKKRVTPTREMTLALVRCCHCGSEMEMAAQNYRKHNREKYSRCQNCVWEDAHYKTGTPIYSKWRGMIYRCQDSQDKNYGGRGISVSQDWMSFKNFYRDMGSTFKKGLTLERVDVNKGYSKENCVWATNLEQQGNKRNNRVLIYKGEQMHLADLCRATGISKIRLTTRMAKGLSPEEAVADARRCTYGSGPTATGTRLKTIMRKERELLAQGRTFTT